MATEQTRRDWVFAISRAAAAGLGMAWTGWGEGTAAATVLPPGVYLPSTDHLGHALMSADRYRPIPAGCPTDYVRPGNGPYLPQFFSDPEFAMVRRMVELMLGDSSSVCQEITEWIDLIVSEQHDVQSAEQKVDPLYQALAVAYRGSAKAAGRASNAAATYRGGLQWLVEAAQSRHAKDFLALEAEQQISLLDSISDARPDRDAPNPGTQLFVLMKADTINGFYTSQAGLKELNFRGNAYYASSPGCNTK